LNGFFSGVWYFWRPFDAFMVDLLETPARARARRRVAEFNLQAAERLLACGVQSIAFPDDLGYNTATFMSPRLYREYFCPWHQRLAALCHDYGAVVNMHSHGNINGILPLLADAGIDILNPVGPSDGMDLAALKARYGDRDVQGGVSNTSAGWPGVAGAPAGGLPRRRVAAATSATPRAASRNVARERYLYSVCCAVGSPRCSAGDRRQDSASYRVAAMRRIGLTFRLRLVGHTRRHSGRCQSWESAPTTPGSRTDAAGCRVAGTRYHPARRRGGSPSAGPERVLALRRARAAGPHRARRALLRNTGIFADIVDFEIGDVRRSTVSDVRDTTRL
jgi:hypothetical protein